VAQDAALSRPKPGFEFLWGHLFIADFYYHTIFFIQKAPPNAGLFEYIGRCYCAADAGRNADTPMPHRNFVCLEENDIALLHVFANPARQGVGWVILRP
jgi:hypothetical protein